MGVVVALTLAVGPAAFAGLTAFSARVYSLQIEQGTHVLDVVTFRLDASGEAAVTVAGVPCTVACADADYGPWTLTLDDETPIEFPWDGRGIGHAGELAGYDFVFGEATALESQRIRPALDHLRLVVHLQFGFLVGWAFWASARSRRVEHA